ncbi:MAG: hypothetical protein K2X71_09480 [Methylobacterium sp.]|uniref:hypothetical protein n=1 Tax=Methylobacterium sp. TaxID=409 RepID=UPI002586A5CE|nr:hypothetical protein [Methylobacterium sp.]MBY0296254.1 hypothetical protein [Methylobacterium sp.]
MHATARFESPLRPDTVEVQSRGYIAAAIWCADLRAAAAPRTATVHRLLPRTSGRLPSGRRATILPFERAAHA